MQPVEWHRHSRVGQCGYGCFSWRVRILAEQARLLSAYAWINDSVIRKVQSIGKVGRSSSEHAGTVQVQVQVCGALPKGPLSTSIEFWAGE